MNGCVLVAGASSQIGRWLLPEFSSAGWDVIATTRQPVASGCGSHGITWLQSGSGDQAQVETEVRRVRVVVSLAPIVSLRGLLAEIALPQLKRLVAFSTSGALLKRASPDSEERGLASLVLEAEEEVKDWCSRQGVGCTILRPTMIYGAGTDKNVSFIAAFIRKYRFFPITGAGVGSRQPVHAEDLAKACVQILSSETAVGRTYCLGGGEVLSYRTMVCRVFEALGIRPRFLPIPNAAIRIGIAALRWLPRYSYLSPEMANRMNQHMVCDTSAASRDFGYAPRPFRPIEQELVATARLRR